MTKLNSPKQHISTSADRLEAVKTYLHAHGIEAELRSVDECRVALDRLVERVHSGTFHDAHELIEARR